MYDLRLWQKSLCTKKNKNSIIPTIELLISFAEKAKIEGLLSIEDELTAIKSRVMKDGLQLIVDGNDPEIVKEILFTKIYAGNFSGRSLLERMIITDGILLLQQGINPSIIREKLYSYLGEDFTFDPEIDKMLSRFPEQTVTKNVTASAHSEFENNPTKSETNIQRERFDSAEEIESKEKLTQILSANNRFISDTPVNEEEIQTLSTMIRSLENGLHVFIKILKSQPFAVSRQILSGFEKYNTEIYFEIKKNWFVFDDLIWCDNRAIQKILREVDTHWLILALKGSNSALKEKIFSNMSNRAVFLIEEDMKYMGPVRLEDVESAQNKIITIAHKLEECGEILIQQPGESIVL